MKVERLDDAADFLAATADFRTADPVLTNLAGSIALSVVNGRVYAAEYWWVARDDDGAVVGCALRTAPYRLIVSPMPADAARAVGEAVSVVDPGLPGINGPHDVVEACYAGLGASKPYRVTMRDVVYVLGTYVPPPAVRGAARRATVDEVSMLDDWTHQFLIDAGLPIIDVHASVAPRIAAGALWLWDVDGTPVAMAGHADLVDTPSATVARIGPVYTPEPLRRQGFGAAISAAVIEDLQRRASVLMLFADAANPASNGVYRRLGFEAVAELVETSLD